MIESSTRDESVLGMSGDAERHLIQMVDNPEDYSCDEVYVEFANEIVRLRAQRDSQSPEREPTTHDELIAAAAHLADVADSYGDFVSGSYLTDAVERLKHRDSKGDGTHDLRPLIVALEVALRDVTNHNAQFARQVEPLLVRARSASHAMLPTASDVRGVLSSSSGLGENIARDAARWRAVARTLHACSVSPRTGYYMTTNEVVDGPMPSASEYADRLIAARSTSAPTDPGETNGK